MVEAQPNPAPSTYRTGEIEARFAPEGIFQIRKETRGTEVTGPYAAEGGTPALSHPEREPRHAVRFPVYCAIAVKNEEFTLQEVQGEGSSVAPWLG